MLQEETSWILHSIRCCRGSLLPTVIRRKSRKNFIEIWWKIWEVMVAKKEFSISLKNILQTMNNSFSMSTISVPTIHQAPSFSTTWFEFAHFPSVQWPFKVVSSTVLTEYLAVTLVHGKMLRIHQPIFVSSSHKSTHYLKCTSTLTTTIMGLPKISLELITLNSRNGPTEILINLLQRSERNFKVTTCRKTSTIGLT